MTFDTLNIAANDNRFRAKLVRPFFRVVHEGAACPVTARFGRDDQPDDLDAKSGFENVRRVGLHPANDCAGGLRRNGDQISLRPEHGLQPVADLNRCCGIPERG